VSLSVAGWALDAVSVLAVKQVEGLTSISLQGGREPGTALHARLLLPLLDKPGLQRLVLLEVSDLNDSWVSDAMQLITAPTGSSSGSSSGSSNVVLASVRELHLGAATDGPAGQRSASVTGSGGGSGGGSSAAGCSNRSTAGSNSSSTPGSVGGAPFSGSGSGDMFSAAAASLLTDKGLVKLCAWPHLFHLQLVGHHIRACPAVSAAPPDSICKAAVGAGGRAVDLWVS
jgi:hypothetical protein